MNMKNKINVIVMSWSNWQLAAKDYPYNHIVISFRTPNKKYESVFYSPWCRGHLEINVHDAGVRDNEKNMAVFNKNHAIQLLALVNKEIDNIHHIVCQCDAGISRSSACAAALGKILGIGDAFIFDNKKYIPNTHIYSTILRVFHELKSA